MEASPIELEIVFIAVLVIALTAAAVYFMSLLGARGKSFEEAIAQQKQLSEQLLGVKSKSNTNNANNSTKDKKKGAVINNSNNKSQNKKQNKKAAQKQQKKQEQILGTQDDDVEIENQESEISELRRDSNIENDDVVSEQVITDLKTVTVAKSEPVILHNGHGSESESQSIPATVLLQKGQASATAKPPRKKVKEIVMEVITADTVTVNEAPVVQAVHDDTKNKSKQQKKVARITPGPSTTGDFSLNQLEDALSKVPLSSSDIQTLIDILLNKQQRGDSEWVNKSKSDSVATLKKQLAEKDQQCLNDQATIQTLNSRIKELRAEFNSEKSSFSSTRRQLDDNINGKKIELQQLQSRYQKLSDTTSEEKSQLQQQLQQVQGTLKSVQNENAGIKTALANLEKECRGKSDSAEKEDETLREQCTHLENQLAATINTNKELTNQNKDLQNSLQNLEELKEKDEKKIHSDYATQIREREEHILDQLKKSQTQKDKLEEEKPSLQKEIGSLQNTISELEKSVHDLNKRLEDSEKSEKIATNSIKDTEKTVNDLENQLSCTHSLLNNLTEENHSLEAQVLSLSQSNNPNDIHKLNQELVELQKRLNQSEEKIQTLDIEKKNLMNDSQTSKQDLKSQKDKNEELHQMTIKLSEAVKLAESKLENQIHQAQVESEEVIAVTRQECETELKTSFMNLFPESSFEGNRDWIQNFASNIHQKLTENLVPTSNDNEALNKLNIELKSYQTQLKTAEEKLNSELDRSANTEKDLRTKLEMSETTLAEAKAEKEKSHQEIEDGLKTNLKNLFPEISFEGKDNWINNFGINIQEKLKTTTTSSNDELTRLNALVKTNEFELKAKEMTLKAIQESVSTTELGLRNKIHNLETELNAATLINQNAKSIDEVQKMLDQVKEEKIILTERCTELENNFRNTNSQTDELHTLKQKLESVEKELDLEKKLKSSIAAVINPTSSILSQLQPDLQSPAKETNGVSNDLNPDAHTPSRSITPTQPRTISPQLSSSSVGSNPSSPNASSATSSTTDPPKEKSKKKKGASKK